jgi:hypothetical protein
VVREHEAQRRTTISRKLVAYAILIRLFCPLILGLGDSSGRTSGCLLSASCLFFFSLLLVVVTGQQHCTEDSEATGGLRLCFALLPPFSPAHAPLSGSRPVVLIHKLSSSCRIVALVGGRIKV